MIRLLEKRFTARVAAAAAWEHLARVESWPSWAKHIRRVELQPAGALGPGSAGRIHLSNGVRSTFRMSQWSPGANCKWTGPFLWPSHAGLMGRLFTNPGGPGVDHWVYRRRRVRPPLSLAAAPQGLRGTKSAAPGALHASRRRLPVPHRSGGAPVAWLRQGVSLSRRSRAPHSSWSMLDLFLLAFVVSDGRPP